jgi:hypothetical protein
MFDATATYTFGQMRTAAGKADITVRWPSDEEWVTHRRRRHIIQTQLGRGAILGDENRGEADLKLYETVRLDGAPPLTADDATFIIGLVERCVVKALELGADDAELELEVLNGERVKHKVEIPTMGQMSVFHRANKIVGLQYNRFEVRASLEAGARLWDDCHGQVEGYTAAVPNIHKDVAIRAVIDAIEEQSKSKHEEANF